MLSLLLHRGRKTRIGLDIGQSGIRAAQLIRANGGYTVLAAARYDVAPPAAGAPLSAEHRGTQFRECLRQGPFQGRRVVAAAPSAAVEFHTLEIPPVILAQTPQEASAVIRRELERVIGSSAQGAETRHWTLPSVDAPGPNVIGVAARRDAIQDIVGGCNEAGFWCTSMDTAATALCRLGLVLRAWDDRHVWGILDLGQQRSRSIICLGDTPVLVRDAGSGGAVWTQRIAEALQISPKTADIHKRDCGIALTARGFRQDGSPPPHGELAPILFGAMRNELNEIAAEIKRSYEYVLSCHPKAQAADLLLVGGGAALGNLPEFLAETLRIPVRRASHYLTDGTSRVQYPSDHREPFESMALAIGLALPEN